MSVAIKVLKYFDTYIHICKNAHCPKNWNFLKKLSSTGHLRVKIKLHNISRACNANK